LKLHPRFSFGIFRLVLLAALVAAAWAVPSRLMAQESAAAPAAQTQASSPAEGAKPEATDEAQSDAFRLEGPVVKWTAKTFNLPATTAASIFELVNFAVIIFGIGIPLYRWLPKFLRGRGEKVSADIESARKATEDANARLSAIEAKFVGLDGEIAKIRAQVEAESLQDEARIKASLAEESARIVAAAEQELTVAAAQARRSLRHFAADLAIDQAAQQMVLTPQADQALIAEFLRDVALTGTDGSATQRGGRN
jgi:F-type H+-transporting ATPase subunit b